MLKCINILLHTKVHLYTGGYLANDNICQIVTFKMLISSHTACPQIETHLLLPLIEVIQSHQRFL